MEGSYERQNDTGSHRKPTKSYQVRALFLKSASLKSRQPLSICCNLICPSIMVSLIGIIGLIIGSLVGNISNEVNTSYPNQINDYELQQRLGSMWLMFANADGYPAAGQLTANGTRLGMLGTSPQVYNSYVDKFVPYFVEYSNAKSIDDALYNAEVQLLNSSNRNNIDYNLLASSAIIFNKLKLNNLTLDYTLQTPSFSNAQYSYLASIITGSMISNDPVVSLVNLIDNAYLSYLTGGNYYINMTIQQFPTYFNVDNIKATVTNIMGILIYPFAFSLLLPSFIHDIVLEKQERLRELMKMMGMKMYMYWLLTWTFDVFLFALVFITLLIIGAAWTLNFFLSPGALFLLILAWGFTLIGMSFLISTFLSRNRTITTFAIYLLIIIGIFVAFGMNLYYGSDKHFPAYLMIYPPFAFYRGLYLISSKCTSHCYTVSQIGGTEISTAIGYLWVEGIIFYILAFYCDKVLPQMFGIRKHPLFFIIEPYQYFKNKKNNNFTSELLLGEIKEDEHEDEDVREERLRILKGNTKDPIIIENLSKIYDDAKKKIAVDRLFLTIKENETFGLLGPNGAGKTTTISMLTGLFAPSSGTAKICGYDIVKEINKVHMVIGICPQFDVQWPTLTVEEHLLFYARLKGVERSQEKSAVIEVATRVGLQGDLVKKSAALSGGMKRRLSVAMALIGNPSIVFLDEPSSGLDPTSRRNLWEVIDYYKNGRSIILTTHSMEEADTLCTRIGIIAKGKLQCIGSPVHLKNKFGKGYSLFVNYNKDHVTEASNYIDKLLGGKYDIVNSVGTYRIYRVDKDSVHVSKILKEIESNRESVGIEDWGLSQTSLEEVFLSICREQEADQNEQK